MVLSRLNKKIHAVNKNVRVYLAAPPPPSTPTFGPEEWTLPPPHFAAKPSHWRQTQRERCSFMSNKNVYIGNEPAYNNTFLSKLVPYKMLSSHLNSDEFELQ